MATKDLKRLLFAGLDTKLQGYGFRLQRTKERFAKRTNDVTNWFTLDFAIYDELHVKPAIGIRVNAVEDRFHRTSGFEQQYQSDTPTLSLSVQGLVGDQSKFEYLIRDQSDVEPICALLERDFKEIVLPYFQKHSDLSVIDSVLNDSPDLDCVHYAMDYLRCAHGVIVAHMVGRANYKELVEVYRRKLALISNGFYLPNFEALVADLANS